MSKKILAIGELLWDILPGERKLGGAPANLAYRLNSLGNPTWLVTRVGSDSDGEEALNILKEHGFHTDYIQIDPENPTGTVNVFFDEHKNPDYTINRPVAYDYIEWNEGISALAQSVDCIVYGTLAQRSRITYDTIHQLIDLAENAVKFCDVNLRKNCYSKQAIEQSLKKATIAKLNHHEAMELGSTFGLINTDLPALVKEIGELFHLEICLVTLEQEGALACTTEGAIHYSPGYRVKMEDPLGAGDAFSAAFLNEWLKSTRVMDALEAGNLYGAIAVQQMGAMQPITNETLRKFILGRKERAVSKKYRAYWNQSQHKKNEQTNIN